MIPAIHLPPDALQALQILKANQPELLGDLAWHKRAIHANAVGHVVAATSLGFKVISVIVGHLKDNPFSLTVELSETLVSVDKDTTERERQVSLLKAAMFFISGPASEYLQGTGPSQCTIDDTFHAQFLCDHLDGFLRHPPLTLFHRVSAFSTEIMANNCGVCAALLERLEERSALDESTLATSLLSVEVEDIDFLLGAMQ